MKQTGALKFRSVMLDLARVTERKSYYFELLPWLARWGYTVVHLHLTDDQGCALVFPSHPELATEGAFTGEEMRDFIGAAGRVGLRVVPEIECLGHARFITDHPRYRALAEPGLEKSGFNAVCPSHPGSRRLLSDLIRDLADIFVDPLIHVGLDEVAFGECKRCRKTHGAQVENWRKFAAHAAWVHEEVRKVGRRPAMWADHAVKNKEMLGDFKHDVLMFHWNYIGNFTFNHAKRLVDGGFEVVCCPATVCWLTRMMPNAENIANLRYTTGRSLLLAGKGVVGFDNTIWCPWRYLPGAIDYGIALAGHLMTESAERPDFCRQFARSFYGIKREGAAGVVGLALSDLANVAFMKDDMERLMSLAIQMSPFCREDQRLCARVSRELTAIVKTLKQARSKVRLNGPRYDDVVISAEALLLFAKFGGSGLRTKPVREATVLLKRAVTAWDRDRNPSDALKYGDVRHFGNEAMLEGIRFLTLRDKP